MGVGLIGQGKNVKKTQKKSKKDEKTNKKLKKAEKTKKKLQNDTFYCVFL